MTSLLPAISSGLIATLLILGLFWKADDLVSESGKAVLSSAINPIVAGSDREAAGQQLRSLLQALLPPPPRTGTYARNIAIMSATSMAIIGVIYFTRAGGLAEQFSSGAQTRNNFIAQLVLDGFLKVFLVNYIGLLPRDLYARGLLTSGPFQAFGVMVMDLVVKLILFALLSVASYVFFARYFGAFGGDWRAAAGAVLLTMRYAVDFQNLTSVYLYSVAIGSFPLFLILVLRLMAAFPAFARALKAAVFWLPFEKKPVRLAATGLAIFFGVFATLAAAFVHPFAPMA